ncbi:hypothetical protein GCM10011328_34910 [Hafnia psychrotolerans]|uniref:Uncharacterized protein n=1 Tax=Hafnia psychrotolerans TaxID=1477018 RepID=A0ABQ1H3K2_9GAMM|nr:hypothetical protein GCM10011328_34910 [Hafnia psychrotolerans]
MLLHLRDLTQGDLNNYLSYDLHSEDNIKASDNEVWFELTHRLEASDEKYHEDINGSYTLDLNIFQNIYTPIFRDDYTERRMY